MHKIAALTASFLLCACPAVFGQDAMQYGLKHLTVLAEDQKVRVLRYAPKKGDKTPIHSPPSSVVYVVKGGRVKYRLPDGSTKIVELKTGAKRQVIIPLVIRADIGSPSVSISFRNDGIHWDPPRPVPALLPVWAEQGFVRRGGHCCAQGSCRPWILR